MITINEKLYNKMPEKIKKHFTQKPNPSRDEVVSLFPESKAGEYKGEGTKSGGIWSESTGQPAGREYGDSGSASRFFYTAKASKEERNFGLYDFEKDVVTDGRTKPIDNAFNRGKTKRKNIHPTVKPIDLMRYLVRLVTPPNGICLDPYLGSGTTAIACEMEKFSWIGIELVPEYAEIAKARIGAVKDYESTLDTKTIIKESIKEDKEKELGIMNIFDFLEQE
jgi:DNA modification methylase